jgi:DNA-binding NarL/FixJ family response regulator
MLLDPVAAYSSAMNTHILSAVLAPHFVGTTVFLVEDSSIIRQRLLQLLNALPAVNVVGQAETPWEAIEQICARQPDVVILDIKLKGGSGINVLREVKRHMPAIVVVMLTNYTSPQFRSQCMQAGADYFLDKTNEFQNIAPILEQRNRTHEQ